MRTIVELEDHVRGVRAIDRLIGWHHRDGQHVDGVELVRLCVGSPRHTCQLLEAPEEVLCAGTRTHRASGDQASRIGDGFPLAQARSNGKCLMLHQCMSVRLMGYCYQNKAAVQVGCDGHVQIDPLIG